MYKQQEFRVFKPDYELERSKIENFLRTFVDRQIRSHPIHEQRKYMIQLVTFYFNRLSKQLPTEGQKS